MTGNCKLFISLREAAWATNNLHHIFIIIANCRWNVCSGFQSKELNGMVIQKISISYNSYKQYQNGDFID